MDKQKKIEQIMALMSGKISAADIPPRLIIHFNQEKGNTYLISDKPVDSDTFHSLLRTLPAITDLVTTGRDNNLEEYYHD
jgi:hypothetical protein